MTISKPVLSFIMLSVLMLNVIIPSVILLKVVAPTKMLPAQISNRLKSFINVIEILKLSCFNETSAQLVQKEFEAVFLVVCDPSMNEL